MREMNAVIAGRVIPATVKVGKAGAIGQLEMAVSAIEIPARALPFEVINDVGKCLSLEQIVFDDEDGGADDLIAGTRLYIVASRRLQAGEIRRPEGPSPVIDFAAP